MDIKQLMTFLRVAELNSFTKAAEVLNYSQSTVSFQVKQLETEIGRLLFERINHALFLTDEGYRMLEYAKQVCRLTEEFHQGRTADEAVTGHVHLVVPDSVCEAMILNNYQDFFRRYPGIQLRFSSTDTEDMFRLLDRNEADLMMTLDNHVYQRNYIIARETRVSTHFFTSAQSPLAHRKNLTIEDVLQQPLILTERGMSYRKVLENTLAQRGIELRPALEIGRTDLIIGALEGGEAVSFLPDFTVRQKVQQGTVVPLEVENVHLDIWQQLIYHRSKWISKALATFIQYVSEHEFQR